MNNAIDFTLGVVFGLFVARQAVSYGNWLLTVPLHTPMKTFWQREARFFLHTGLGSVVAVAAALANWDVFATPAMFMIFAGYVYALKISLRNFR